jgi:Cytochrome P450
MTLVYGKTINPDGKDLKTILHILETFIQDIHPARHLVDTFPALDYLPNWLAPWRIEAIGKYEEDSAVRCLRMMCVICLPVTSSSTLAFSRMSKLRWIMALILNVLLPVSGKVLGNWDLMKFPWRLESFPSTLACSLVHLTYLSTAAGSAFEAGTDNVAGSILWFLEAMMLYPDVMKKAQAEIDSVLGTQADTPPGFRHLEQLPYCISLTKEVFRWMPVAPIGGPRRAEKDDEYKGYHIAAGTIIFPNIWSIHHNEFTYPDPFTFKPDRFLSKGGSLAILGPESLNEGHCAFGFGRRWGACPCTFVQLIKLSY